MQSFIRTNKSLLTYLIILFMVVPFFGLNVLISFIGNILILLILVPILVLILFLISLNSFQSRINTCDQCGTISFGINKKCNNCGSEIDRLKINKDQFSNNPSESIIEVKAEEIN